MSLLLDALKKAEAKQDAKREAAKMKSTDSLRSSTPLELTAIDSKSSTASSNYDAKSNSSYSNLGSKSSQSARVILNQRRSPSLQNFRWGFWERYLTFPIVVAFILAIGIPWGAWVLYKSYTDMPSLVASNSPSAPMLGQSAPIDTASKEITQSSIVNSPIGLSSSNTPEKSISPPQSIEYASTENIEPTPSTETTFAAAIKNPPSKIQIAPPVKNREVQINSGHGSIYNATLATYLNKGYEALLQNDRVSATDNYQHALQLDGNNIDALLGLGYLAQQNGAREQAEYYFKRALQIDPRDAYALSALASQTLQSGHADLGLLEHQIKNLSIQNGTQELDNAALQFTLGNSFAAQQRWNEAQQAYFKAVSIEPYNPNYLFNLAVSLDQLHQPSLALEYYRKALAMGISTQASAPPQFNRVELQQRANALEKLAASMSTLP